jgi:hypothetical protein
MCVERSQTRLTILLQTQNVGLVAYFAVGRTAHRLTSRVSDRRISSDRCVGSVLHSDHRVGPVLHSDDRVCSIRHISTIRVVFTRRVDSTQTIPGGIERFEALSLETERTSVRPCCRWLNKILNRGRCVTFAYRKNLASAVERPSEMEMFSFLAHGPTATL